MHVSVPVMNRIKDPNKMFVKIRTSRQTQANAKMSVAGVRSKRFKPSDCQSSSSGAIHRTDPPWLDGCVLSAASAMAANPKSAIRTCQSSSMRMFDYQ
jgi:hypothetical protein